jgi:hypothetical protein
MSEGFSLIVEDDFSVIGDLEHIQMFFQVTDCESTGPHSIVLFFGPLTSRFTAVGGSYSRGTFTHEEPFLFP